MGPRPIKMKGVVILIIICIVFIYYNRNTTVSIHGWNVSDYHNKQEAAELLSKVNTTMITFMRSLKKRYNIDVTNELDNQRRYVGDTRAIISALLDNYNPEVFYENDPKLSTDTAYTVNKGVSMYICLRDRTNPDKVIDFDTVLFVLLHEASHIANYNGWGHNQRFWEVFKFILNEAVISGVYKPIDYSKHPVVYCGLRVENNPYFDDSLKNIWLE